MLSPVLCLWMLQATPGPPPAEEPGSSAAAVEPAAEQSSAVTARRAELNLLGETDASAGESRRNENVQFNLVDNNARRDLNVRLGPTATLIRDFEPERNYFAAEYGNPASASIHNTRTPGAGVHGQLFYRHLNSVFSARSFFQVGGVQPARENEYGFGLAAPLWRKTRLFTEASQRKLRGQVNGNVQIPTREERTPLTTDPALRRFVEDILSAYPDVEPNRPDIDPRMLNTNSPQTINGDNATLKLDQELNNRDSLFASYQYLTQQVIAFQLIRGQNPDTTTRSHRGRLTWSRAISPSTVWDSTLGFDRATVLIVPERNHTGSSIFVSGGALTTINGSTQVPIDRALNEYRAGSRLRLNRGAHTLSFGGDLLRRQLNGYDSDNHFNGTFAFRANFGNDPITNLRLGLPTTYFRGLGVISRGYRTWLLNAWAGDEWRLHARFTLTLGVRWNPVTRPLEVNRYEEFPYRSDWNNFAPQAGLAWRGLGGTVRAHYGLFFGEIFPATYQQARFNPPWNVKLIVNDPDPLNPLEGVVEPEVIPRSTRYDFADDLVTPYVSLYGASWERPLSPRWTLQLGYVGSRSKKLLLHWYENRARVVPGIPTTTLTINDRRPDPGVLDIRRVVNSGKAWYDAGKIQLTGRAWRGLSLEGAYWLSKNIDTGSDYLNTAYDVDSFRGMSQSQDLVNEDLKGLSRFDQPHAFLSRLTWSSPRGWHAAVRNWEFGSVVLLKSGTPFNLISGADSPGFGNVDGANGDRPHILEPTILGRTIGHPDTAPQRLPRSAFAYILPGEERGNIGRNTFRRGGIYNVNASLQRTWRWNGDLELRLRGESVRGESVNFLNTPQFAEPGPALADPNFGRITNTLNDGRTFRFEFALRF